MHCASASARLRIHERRIARQARDDAILRSPAMLLAIVIQELDLHARHVDAGRTLAPAAFAADAQIQHVVHALRRQRIASELPGQCVSRNALARPRVTSCSSCVAMNDGHITSAFLRHAPLLLHISTAPENPPQSDQSSAVSSLIGCVARRIAKERTIVHQRRAHDLAGIEETCADRTRL